MRNWWIREYTEYTSWWIRKYTEYSWWIREYTGANAKPFFLNLKVDLYFS